MLIVNYYVLPTVNTYRNQSNVSGKRHPKNFQGGKKSSSIYTSLQIYSFPLSLYKQTVNDPSRRPAQGSKSAERKCFEYARGCFC